MIMWLSIVVPLYNCEKYVGSCLDSLLSQGLKYEEYEIIVVDDGSTDSSASVVEEYVKRYPNITLLKQPNSGVAVARNTGKNSARGEYIHFMDADDMMLSGGYRELYDNYLKDKEHPDMLVFSSRTVDKYYNKEIYDKIQPHKECYRGTFFDYGKKYGFGWSCCFRLLSRKFLESTGIELKPYVISEDVYFMMELFKNVDATMVVTDLNIYRYYVRNNSALTRMDKAHILRVVNGNLELHRIVQNLKNVSPYPCHIFENELNQFRRHTFIRMLSVPMSFGEIKELLNMLNKDSFFEFQQPNGMLQKLMKFAHKSAVSMYLLSFPVRFFVLYVKPWVKRN